VKALKQIKFEKGLLRTMAKMGCAIRICAYEAESGDSEVCRIAIGQTFGKDCDHQVLASIEPRKMRERSFFGDWLDFDTGKLIKRGTHSNDAGVELINPTLLQLANFRARSSGGDIPEAGEGGQFAYAFLCPPYSLRGDARKIQETFDALRAALLPEDSENEIRDWTSPRLPEFSAYFKAGMEWWGIFLFTIFDSSRKRLLVLSASTTD
jgi:hypothetical protein